MFEAPAVIFEWVLIQVLFDFDRENVFEKVFPPSFLREIV